MTPTQLFEESIYEQFHHVPGRWLTDDQDATYGFLLSKHILKAGTDLLPILTNSIEQFSAATSTRCDEIRYFVSLNILSDIDNELIRLRNVNSGLNVLGALDRSIGRLKVAGVDKPNHRLHSLYAHATENAKMANGTSIRDEMIRETLKIKHGIELTNDQFAKFSRFLISEDPSYPAWSEIDTSGPPTILKDSKKYFAAYLRFNSSKH